jgi:hypothetical protein
MQSMSLSVESMNIVLRHRSLGIQTMRAVVDDCIEAGKLIDAGQADAAKATLRGILQRISETADMYVNLQDEVFAAEQQSGNAVKLLSDWLKSTLP